MATIAQGATTSSDAQYRIGYASTLYYEGIINNPINRILSEAGCINREEDLSRNGGGTFTMYNDLKLNGKGNTGDDVDLYASSVKTEKNSRTMLIALNSYSINWPLKGTQSQQFTPYDIGQNNERKLADWAKALYSAAMINQLASNTATAITQYALDTASSFSSAADLLRITGNNAATVPTYHYWGSSPTTARTTDASISSSDVLTLGDFQAAAENITSQPAAAPAWQTLTNKPYLACAIISFTGFNQLLNEAKTLGQGFQTSEVMMRQIEAGSKVEPDIQTFTIPGIPFKFVVVNDSWLPRGVNLSSGAEVANSRRAVIVGMNAIDVAFGAGYGGLPGADIEFDTQYKKLNKQGFGAAKMLWGCKKTQSTGAGAGNTTAYDLSTYVICHYSRT